MPPPSSIGGSGWPSIRSGSFPAGPLPSGPFGSFGPMFFLPGFSPFSTASRWSSIASTISSAVSLTSFKRSMLSSSIPFTSPAGAFGALESFFSLFSFGSFGSLPSCSSFSSFLVSFSSCSSSFASLTEATLLSFFSVSAMCLSISSEISSIISAILSMKENVPSTIFSIETAPSFARPIDFPLAFATSSSCIFFSSVPT